MYTRSTAQHSWKLVLALILALGVCLLAASSSLGATNFIGATNFTWAWAAPLGEPKWSRATNLKTTTKLATKPASPATNQAVTLTATVAALTATVAATVGKPFGTVRFENHGVAIPACDKQPLLHRVTYTAKCKTAFAASSSPEALAAVFNPGPGIELGRSASPVENLTVVMDSTTAALEVSSPAPGAGANVTYTATVTPEHAGSTLPSGSVEFLDGGVAIAACARQPLIPGASSSSATCTLSYSAAGAHSITVAYLGDFNFSEESTSLGEEVSVQGGGGGAGGSLGGGGSSGEAHGGVLGTHIASGGSATPSLGQRQTVAITAGTATIRPKGTSSFVPLSGSTSIPDESEVDATNGRILVTVASTSGGTVSAELSGGRFRLHQDASGTTRFTLTLALAGCQAVALPRGSAARAKRKHRSGPTSRHVWVSETGGKWGTNGRYVSTSVEGTTWLTLDECTRSEVTVTAGKVLVRDLLRKRTTTLTPGKSYIATRSPKGRRR